MATESSFLIAHAPTREGSSQDDAAAAAEPRLAVDAFGATPVPSGVLSIASGEHGSASGFSALERVATRVPARRDASSSSGGDSMSGGAVSGTSRSVFVSGTLTSTSIDSSLASVPAATATETAAAAAGAHSNAASPGATEPTPGALPLTRGRRVMMIEDPDAADGRDIVVVGTSPTTSTLGEGDVLRSAVFAMSNDSFRSGASASYPSLSRFRAGSVTSSSSSPQQLGMSRRTTDTLDATGRDSVVSLRVHGGGVANPVPREDIVLT
jgi:hypothetical protein